jgi:hypothetical protein
MPPAKSQDARLDGSSTRERQLASAAHARAKKQTMQSNGNNNNVMHNGSGLKELALYNADAATQPPQTGVSLLHLQLQFSHCKMTDNLLQMAWNTAPIDLLDTYRVSHNLQTPTAFTRLSSQTPVLDVVPRLWHARKRREGYLKSNWHWQYERISTERL